MWQFYKSKTGSYWFIYSLTTWTCYWEGLVTTLWFLIIIIDSVFITFIASFWLFNHMLKRNSWCAPWRFDTKQTEKLIKLTAKYFNSVLQPILSLKLARCFAQWLYMYSSLFYSWKNYFLVFCLRDIMYLLLREKC